MRGNAYEKIDRPGEGCSAEFGETLVIAGVRGER
jgi:hypothetical protein